MDLLNFRGITARMHVNYMYYDSSNIIHMIFFDPVALRGANAMLQ
jgi:hypothetical protein